MLKRSLLIGLMSLLLVTPGFAAGLSVAEGVITTQVVDHAPIDELESYPAQLGKLFCFTRIIGAEGETTVTHVWFYQDQEMARIDLPVRSPSWRTYSSKNILPQWAGDWKVQVLDDAGLEIGVIPFKLL
ncbi:MAG: DUF2914 domain-containing protein [Desulfuromonas sp.]|nr:MAG: DUF2914 domain-containing protein [Desulfuromonas sp.]